ncbi:MAG: hypothetical protein NTY19_26335 [Planctomycetota bacterium]|nr:hypothetical protein [Planctomycetota bacterium]
MDTPTNQPWWALHVRVSRGEMLSEEQRITYEKGLKELHDEESLADLSVLRQTRAAVMELDAKCDELHARRQQLKGRIAHLEAALTEEARRNLGIGN